MPLQVSVESEHKALAGSNSAQLSSAIQPVSIKCLAPNEILFHVGDRRDCLYRVETGSVCTYEPHLNGGHAVIDFAFSGDLIGLGTEMGLVNKRGSHYSYGDLRLGQGRENAKEYLSQHPEAALELENQIRAQSGLPPLAAQPNTGERD